MSFLPLVPAMFLYPSPLRVLVLLKWIKKKTIIRTLILPVFIFFSELLLFESPDLMIHSSLPADTF